MLDEYGLPSKEFRENADLSLACVTVLFTFICNILYICKRTSENPLSPAKRSYRLAALVLSVALSGYSIIYSTPWFYFFPFLGVCAVHFSEIYICPQKVPSWELLMFYPLFSADQALRMLDQSYLVVSPTIILSGLIVFLELKSAPQNVSDFEDAHLYLRFGHSFMEPLINKAKVSIIKPEELSTPPKPFLSINTQYFARTYVKFKRLRKLRIWLAMLWTTKKYVAIQAVCLFSLQTLAFLVPSIMREFLQYLSLLEKDHSREACNGSLWLSIALALCSLLYCGLRVLNHYYDLLLTLEWRLILSNFTYQKAMSIDSECRQDYNSGKIMNLITNDVAEMQGAYGFLVEILKQPYGILLGSYELYKILGSSFWFTFPLFTLHTICTSFIQNKAAKGLPNQSAARDRRNKSTLTILRNIKSLKLYAWEEPFEEKVKQDYSTERREVKNYLKMSVGANCLTSQMSNILLGFIILAFLATTDNPLTPDTIFPLIKLTAVAISPYSGIPNLWRDFSSMLNSEIRLNNFYEQPEESSDKYYHILDSPSSGEPSVTISNATIAWPHSTTALENLNIEVKKNDMLCIVGKIGSGKSAIVQAIIGQMSILNGTVAVRGSMAYAGQDPWLQFQSVRDNVLFGLEYDESFYKQVIKACELENDFAIFPDGDKTMVGEKGITLSGGQKARLALARAVYSRADVIVLDDVLSAVDQEVCRGLLINLFSPETGIVGDKAVILATHSSQPLKFCNKLLVLGAKGQIEYCGEAKNVPASVTLDVFGNDKPSEIGNDRKNITPKDIAIPNEDPHTAMVFKKTFGKSEKPRTLSVFNALKRYFGLGSKRYAAIVVFSAALNTSIVFFTTLWLSYWSNKELVGLNASKMYLLVYFSLLLLQVLSDMTSRFTFQAVMVTDIAKKIHGNMLNTVIHSPMKYFESTPLGTIINRFTGDLSKADRQFPAISYQFVFRWISATSSFLLAVFGAPFIIIFAVPLMFQGKKYKDQYLPATSQITNLVAASRAPVLSHVEESTKGVATIKAFDKGHQFINSMVARQRYQTYCAYNASYVRRWLLTRALVIAALITGSAAISLVAGVKYFGIPVSLAGVTLLTIERSNSQIRGILMGYQRFEQATNAVERCFSLADQPTEAAYHLPSDRSGWVTEGMVEFKKYTTSFRDDLPHALHEVDLKIEPKEKIGVVGRTGAGKTTLTLALFRILEAQSGTVEIDGVDVSQVGLYNLRTQLSSIPQDAQIFRGTVRENLDPFNRHTDEELHEVMKLCHLEEHIDSLEFELDESGSNISSGQAQLMCLGRALLRPAKILVMDEATASVDGKTDSVVQRTIREELSERTIITIVHRLDTIMDSDRVLVLSDGRIVEQGPPHELLKLKGHFYRLKNGTN